MIHKLKNIFGFGNSVDFAKLVNGGAIILDVRNENEFAGDHIKSSINIPLHQLSRNLDKLKNKSKPIITCCASGMRSAAAKDILKLNGYTEVLNGGGWQTLNKKIK